MAVGLVHGGWADGFELMDPGVLAKEKAEWRSVQLRYRQLEREHARLKAQLYALEQEAAQLKAQEAQAHLASDLTEFLFERSYRIWTSASGVRLLAKVQSYAPTTLRLRSSKGEELVVRVSHLQADDQRYLFEISQSLALRSKSMDFPQPILSVPGR
jgi:hypothetical protein